MTDHDTELAAIAADEAALQFRRFDPEIAWRLGCWLRETATARGLAISIDVFANGMTWCQIALAGARPDNAEWIRRKRNLCLRTFTSSRATQLRLAHAGVTLEARLGVSPQDFAAAGGSVPIRVAGAGVIGAVTVSGLTAEADHALAIEALRALTQA